MTDIDPPPRPRATNKAKAMTRPQDWAPAARAHLFGLATLNEVELVRELRRRAAYPGRYPRTRTR